MMMMYRVGAKSDPFERVGGSLSYKKNRRQTSPVSVQLIYSLTLSSVAYFHHTSFFPSCQEKNKIFYPFTTKNFHLFFHDKNFYHPFFTTKIFTFYHFWAYFSQSFFPTNSKLFHNPQKSFTIFYQKKLLFIFPYAILGLLMVLILKWETGTGRWFCEGFKPPVCDKTLLSTNNSAPLQRDDPTL